MTNSGLLTQGMTVEQAQLLDQRLRKERDAPFRQPQGNYGGGALGGLLSASGQAINSAALAGRNIGEAAGDAYTGREGRGQENTRAAVERQKAIKVQEQDIKKKKQLAVQHHVEQSNTSNAQKTSTLNLYNEGVISAEKAIERVAPEPVETKIIKQGDTSHLVNSVTGAKIKSFVGKGDKKEQKYTPIKAYNDSKGNIVEGAYKGGVLHVLNDSNKLVPAAEGAKYTPIDLSKKEEWSPAQKASYSFKLGRLDDASEVVSDIEKSFAVYESSTDLLNKGINSGAFTDIKNKTLKVAAFLGFELGDELETVARTEAYQANMGNAVASVIKAFGSGTGLSDKDREYAEKIAGGNVEVTEETLRRLVDLQAKYMRVGIEKYNKRVRMMGEGFEDELKDIPRERRAYFGDMQKNTEPSGATVYINKDRNKVYNADGYLIKELGKKGG